MNILFVDVETTGTNPIVHDITSIGCQLVNNGNVSSSFSVEICPSKEKCISMELGALQVNKGYQNRIDDRLDGNYSSSVAAKKFAKYLASLPNNVYIAGHNVHFDIKFINEFLNQHRFTGFENLFSKRIIDTSTIAVFLRDAKIINPKGLKLFQLAEYYNVNYNTEMLHDASYDAQLTYEIYNKMISSLNKGTNNGTN